MGRQGEAARLFHECSLERHGQAEPLRRRIDRALDLSWLRFKLAPFYGSTDRLSDRPRTDDPRAPGGALLRHPLGVIPLHRGGGFEQGLRIRRGARDGGAGATAGVP